MHKIVPGNDEMASRSGSDYRSDVRSGDYSASASQYPILSGSSNDPGVRLAFNQSLDAETQRVESHLGPEQTFYECRIASIERFIAFCVMLHAMAVECRKPLFRVPWDIARSQSNLRVATTGSSK